MSTEIVLMLMNLEGDLCTLYSKQKQTKQIFKERKMGIYMTSGLIINSHYNLEDIVTFDWAQISAGHKKNEFIYEYRDCYRFIIVGGEFMLDECK